MVSGTQVPSRYDDETFRASAKRKAVEVVRRLESHVRDCRELAIVSVGGADGTELFELCRLTNSRHGILVEYADRSMASARERAKAASVELVDFTGDVMDKLEEAVGTAIKLREAGRVTGVLVSACAVLHELFTRSHAFALHTYFSKLYQADIIVGREPIEPLDWPTRVLIQGSFDKASFSRLAELIRSKHFKEDEYMVQRLGETSVELHRALALETLTKAFYSEDFLYELGECVSSISHDQLLDAMRVSLGETHSDPDCELLTSLSFSEYWERCRIRVVGTDAKELHKPKTHMWYFARRKVRQSI